MFGHRRRWQALFGTAALIALSITGTANAAGSPRPAEPRLDPSVAPALAGLIRQADHPMGSQVRAHERTGSGPRRVTASALGVEDAVYGIDVSGWQGNVDWNSLWGQGKRFAYVKATEGTDYTNPYFAQQYNGSYDVGMIRGSYHFARPDVSGGAAQADYFVDHGGGWSADGKTLPGTLDIEWNPNGAACYGYGQWDMIGWVKDFSDQYHNRTGVWPVIYTATSWWSQCTGNLAGFKTTNPLWVARYADGPGQLPFDWDIWTFWQYSDSPIDQDVFNGGYDRLVALALG
ncbi:lysozyme [Amycolatopsis sp. NPDC059021]|uniref:lysozyme n=1 Tax=Amycolatopsis sp. NPDC059021 TaxID=3346704 RepID=UPI003670EE0A